jgi:shikimate kinase
MPGPSRIVTVDSTVSQLKELLKTNRVHRGSARSRRVRTRSRVPLLQSLPSTSATPTRAVFAIPSGVTVIIAAVRFCSRNAASLAENRFVFTGRS